MTRVVVVAAALDKRSAIAATVRRSATLVLIRVASSPPEMATTAALDAPDVVVLHAASVGAAARAISALPPLPVVVLLAEPDLPVSISELVAAGARAVLADGATSDELAGAIAAVTAGLIAVPLEVADQRAAVAVRDRVSAGDADVREQPGRGLTPREREVLTMLAEGLPNKLIASRLGISDHTVKTHVEALFEKLGASTRAEAVARGVRTGLLLL